MSMNENRQQPRQDADDEILRELKSAYKAINSLNKTASHRKIEMQIERKLRAIKESQRKSK